MKDVNDRQQGLYRSEFEHDACGVGMVADVENRPSHDIVLKGLTVLKRLMHRGATGNDPRTGDGAGLLMRIPDAFFRKMVKNLDPLGPSEHSRRRHDPDAVPPRDGGREPRARQDGAASLGRRRRPVRRGPRGHALRAPPRLRRDRDQPVPRDGDGLGAVAGRHDQGRVELRAGRRPRTQEDHVQDGHLDAPLLSQRPDLRGRRSLSGPGRRLLHRRHLSRRRHRSRRNRKRGESPGQCRTAVRPRPRR